MRKVDVVAVDKGMGRGRVVVWTETGIYRLQIFFKQGK